MEKTIKMRCPDCKNIIDKILGAEKQFCPQCGQRMEEFDEFAALPSKKCSNPEKNNFHDALMRPEDFYCQICGFALA